MINDKEPLLNQIKKYSKRKFFGVVPGISLSLLGAISFFIFISISMFISISPYFPIISGSMMISGILIALFFIMYTEHLRNLIMRFDLYSFIEMFAYQINATIYNNNILYYDIIDVLLTKVRIIYHNNPVSIELSDINSCLNKILLEDSSAGIANKFVYNNRADFIEICKLIIIHWESWDYTSTSNEIYNKYSKYSINPSDFHYNKKLFNINTTIIRATINRGKTVLFIVLLLTFVFQCSTQTGDMISYIFNIAAIFLLFFDLLERKLIDR